MGQFTQQYTQKRSTNTIYKKPKTETPSHYLLHRKQFEELRSKMMEDITYIFNINGTTFRNTIAKLLGEHILNNDSSNKVR